MLTLTESTSAFSEDDFQLLGIPLFSLKHVERFSCKRHYEHFDDAQEHFRSTTFTLSTTDIYGSCLQPSMCFLKESDSDRIVGKDASNL